MRVNPITGEVLDIVLYEQPPLPAVLSTRWAYDTYPDAMEDFNKWMLSVAYWQVIKEKQEEEIKTAKREKRDPIELSDNSNWSVAMTVAEAALKRLHATYNLADNMERAMIMQLWEAQTSGWPQLLGREYGGLREIFENMLEDSKGRSTSYDLMFWIETLLPAVEFLHIDPELVLRVPDNFRKSREALPLIHRYWKDLDNKYRKDMKIEKDENGKFSWTADGIGQGGFDTRGDAIKDFQGSVYKVISDTDKDQLKQAITNIIKAVVDPDITFKKLSEILSENDDKDKSDKPTEVNGQMFITPHAEILVIKSPSPRFTHFIESRLRGLVDGFMPTSMRIINEDIISEVTAKLYVLDIKNKKLIKSKNGNGFPMPDNICNIVRVALAEAMGSIFQATTWGVNRWDVPVYSYMKSSDMADSMLAAIAERFRIPTNPDANEMIMTCFTTLPEALVAFFNKSILDVCDLLIPKDYRATVMCGEMEFVNEWGIFVRVTLREGRNEVTDVA